MFAELMLLIEGAASVPEAKKELIRQINRKLDAEFKKHRGFANLTDAKLTMDEIALVMPYAIHGQHGPYMTMATLERFLKKEGRLLTATSGDFNKSVSGSTAGMSPNELRSIARGHDVASGKPHKRETPDWLALSGPYTDVVGGVQQRAGAPARFGKDATD